MSVANNCYDIIFMSTVLDHLFFPFFAIYKMIRMAREWVIIDVPQLVGLEEEDCLMRMSFPEDYSHHGFVFKKAMIKAYVIRLGVPEEDIFIQEYNDSHNVLYKIDVSRCRKNLVGA